MININNNLQGELTDTSAISKSLLTRLDDCLERPSNIKPIGEVRAIGNLNTASVASPHNPTTQSSNSCTTESVCPSTAGPDYISLLLNHHNFNYYLTIDRSHQINRHQR